MYSEPTRRPSVSNQLTLSNLKERLSYDPLTGVLSRTCHWNPRHKDDMAIGYYDSYGYLKLNVGGVRHGAHQVIWFIMTGKWPDMEIDHINGDPSDNRWENLRHVSHQENLSNRANLPSDNKTGAVGVCWVKGKEKFRAYHTQFGKQTHIGYFGSIKDAKAAREAYLTTKRVKGVKSVNTQ